LNSKKISTKQFVHIHILVKIDNHSFNYIGLPDEYIDEKNCAN